MKTENTQKQRHAPALTIIICIYNTDFLYLEECLNSIAKERLEGVEIIVVDDGSTKKYTPLIERHGARYIRTENMGLLHARAVGILNASGDHIAFVDADDAVSECYHKPMLDAAVITGADIVIGEWAYLTKGGIRVHESEVFGKEGAYDSALPLLLEASGRDHTYYVMWNKIFKTSLLRKCVDEIERLGLLKMGITYGEDLLYSYFIYRNSGHVLPFSSGFYMYRIHPGQSVRGDDRERLAEQIRSLGAAFAAMERCESDEYNLGLIRKWRAFSSRHHYSTARRRGYRDLYPLIRETYRTQKLKRRGRGDASAYARCEAVGRNFGEIDRILKQIYDTGTGIEVFYEKKCKYLGRILSSYDRVLSTRFGSARGHSVTIPKRRLSLTDRLVSSHLIMKAASIILPPGSRIRAALKRIFIL